MRRQVSFFAASLSSPRRTGALAPSSGMLGRAMARAAGASDPAKILEFGPGTGTVTSKLIEAGAREENLTLVELNPVFAHLLADRFPLARVISGEALAVAEALRQERTMFSSVVSSLPCMNFPHEFRENLLVKSMELLQPGRPLVQFTYSLAPPLPKLPTVRVTRTRRIWANMPPAVVWSYRIRLGSGQGEERGENAG
ncbi:phosphatidylethanolamine/phosphatidyl-N-methylethanolamine N-methyltransferase [Aestuariispira insulae]|uniref:Phosphatidylethanolamine/phosphatidyl-N-methylethanolamine N-methyltransferase n=2 Tax=Aestuariispira insulae TaxID=1461337 RepID=A0A3D9HSL1_9PROT|nr:phosphatidylethanolamine/phosphatidyl-N-methylethanolamine N-methyltransferase [Aestuariispira insulae]